MATEYTRNEVWQGLLDTARLVRYYHALTDQYHRKRTVLRFLILVAATGSIGALLGILPPLMNLIANSLIAACVAWDFVQDYATKAAVLHTIRNDCTALEGEWRTLWNEQAYLTDRDILQRTVQLSQKLNTITGRAGEIGVQEDVALNTQCATDAYQVMKDRYAV